MQASILALFVLCCCLLGGKGEQEFSFRVSADKLQVLLDSSGAQEWRTITRRGFDYREGVVVCRNLTNGTMVDFEKAELSEDSDESMYGQVFMNCNSLPWQARNCFYSLESDSSVISNITCESTSGHQEGDTRLLRDGRLVQLKEVGGGQFVWGHFCADDNDNWDLSVSSLACQSLGYERAREGKYYVSIEDNFVYGLTDIDCTGATDFHHCTSEPIKRNSKNCDDNEVIAVVCEGKVSGTTSKPMATYSVNTASSSYSLSTTNAYITTSTAYTRSHHPSYTTQSYNNTVFLAQYLPYLIAGVVALGITLMLCTLGIIAVIGNSILTKRICNCKKQKTKEEIRTPENAESIEYDHYLRMEPHPNGYIKPEEDRHYYNTEQLVATRPYQHTYSEIQPIDSSDSSESGYAEIQSL